MSDRDQHPPRPGDATLLNALAAGSEQIALAVVGHDSIRAANPAFRRLFGGGDAMNGTSLSGLLAPEDRGRAATLLQAAEARSSLIITACRNGGAGTPIELRFEPMCREGEPLTLVAAQDITERLRAQAHLNLLAYSDPLTGLANRALFTDRLRQAAMAARRAGQTFTLLMLDLDGFKSVNDRHGHDAGDCVLRRLASRALACLRETDTVARLGGDEFAALLTPLKRREDAFTVAGRLADAARLPIRHGQSEIRISASVGIAIFPEHAQAVDALLAAADAALYAAKRTGRGTIAWAAPCSPAGAAPRPLAWDPAHELGVREIDQQHAHLASLLNDLADALRDGQYHGARFREVLGYTRFHFDFEERLMEECRYAGLAMHRALHRGLIDDLLGLRLDEADDAAISTSLTLRYLQDWLLRHVDGADRDLAAALRDAGAATAAITEPLS